MKRPDRDGWRSLRTALDVAVKTLLRGLTGVEPQHIGWFDSSFDFRIDAQRPQFTARLYYNNPSWRDEVEKILKRGMKETSIQLSGTTIGVTFCYCPESELKKLKS